MHMAYNIQNVMDNFFDDVSTYTSRQTSSPSLNIYETDDYYKILFRAPGINPEQLKVEVKGSTLTLSYEEEKDSTEDHGTALRREYREHQSFSRSITMPDDIDSESVSADYKRGIFDIRVHKKPEMKPQAIKVNISE
jgi:HSP20 family protein